MVGWYTFVSPTILIESDNFSIAFFQQLNIDIQTHVLWPSRMKKIFITVEIVNVYVPKTDSQRASSPIWASEASLARTRERAAKPRGAEERRACNHPLQIFICTSPRRREIPLAEKWRSGNQSWLITGQAGTRFVCVSNLVLRGIRLVPRTCFSPQSRRGGSFDLVSQREYCEPRISRSEFIVLVERKLKPFFSCICLCKASYLILKTRRVKVKRDSSARFHSSPISKYEHRRTSALWCNIRNIRICMRKTYPFCNLRKWKDFNKKKNSLPYMKCVLRLSCVVHTVNGFLSIYWGFQRRKTVVNSLQRLQSPPSSA